MKKEEIQEVLVEKFGYDPDDVKLKVAELRELLLKEQRLEVELEAQAAKLKAPDKRKFLQDDMIPVMSGVSGTLIYNATNGAEYRFESYGGTDEIPYGELVRMRNKHGSYLTEASLIILDDELVKEFRLAEIYKYVYAPEEMEELLNSDVKEIAKVIPKLPEAMKVTFSHVVRNKYKRGEIDSISLTNLVESHFRHVKFDEIDKD